MTALFAIDSPTATRLTNHGHAQLDFSEYNQSYELPCKVRNLEPDTDGYQATFWHQPPVQPESTGGGIVIGFKPDWSNATAEPPITQP